MILVEYLHIIFSGTLSANPLGLSCKWFAHRGLVPPGGGKWIRGGRLWGQWLRRAPQPPRTASTPPSVQMSGIGKWSEQSPRWLVVSQLGRSPAPSVLLQASQQTIGARMSYQVGRRKESLNVDTLEMYTVCTGNIARRATRKCASQTTDGNVSRGKIHIIQNCHQFKIFTRYKKQCKNGFYTKCRYVTEPVCGKPTREKVIIANILEDLPLWSSDPKPTTWCWNRNRFVQRKRRSNVPSSMRMSASQRMNRFPI